MDTAQAAPAATAAAAAMDMSTPAAAAEAATAAVAAAPSVDPGQVRVKPEPMDTEAAHSSMAVAASAMQGPPLVVLMKHILSTGAKTWSEIWKVVSAEKVCNPALAEITITDQAISKALIVAEAVELPASSQTPAVEDRLYALGSTGNETLDSYRRVILSLFTTQQALSRRTINDAVNKTVGGSESKDITRLLKEMCMKQGTNWVIRRPVAS
eukprot:scpid57333/ scgid25500/ 